MTIVEHAHTALLVVLDEDRGDELLAFQPAIERTFEPHADVGRLRLLRRRLAKRADHHGGGLQRLRGNGDTAGLTGPTTCGHGCS